MCHVQQKNGDDLFMFQPRIKGNLEDMHLDIAFMNTELAKLGFESILILGNSKRKYTVTQYAKIVPMMADWLFAAQRLDTRDIILGALGTRSAKPLAAKPLIKAYFQSDTDESFAPLRWYIGNALDYVADDSVVDNLIKIALNASYGRDRMMVVSALGNLKDERAGKALCDLLEDDIVYLGALGGLAKSGYAPARPFVEKFLFHKEAWARRKAHQILAKIDKKQKSQSDASNLL